MLHDPENFEYVKVAGQPDAFSGEDTHGPWRVVGINRKWDDEVMYYKNVETLLVGDIQNKQVAETWLRVYLERYVKDAYFNGPRDC